MPVPESYEAYKNPHLALVFHLFTPSTIIHLTPPPIPQLELHIMRFTTYTLLALLTLTSAFALAARDPATDKAPPKKTNKAPPKGNNGSPHPRATNAPRADEYPGLARVIKPAGMTMAEFQDAMRKVADNAPCFGVGVDRFEDLCPRFYGDQQEGDYPRWVRTSFQAENLGSVKRYDPNDVATVNCVYQPSQAKVLTNIGIDVAEALGGDGIYTILA
ncbi:hypothetical protein L198_07175 [Cryptococcus wingfieldii CBS 7118]|uniref:Uncharacterized protein n=1 Tax=Cryptococcus wingfieldii CBS 7118 TaxID=1295528 RepID=A0A1E3IDZ7_9TREE|nr:hypothetical protein L198_07175 [Cryptococcus wingfieldii CBS 7118]ODN86813.1 hypothetical protein L198_07175 [Cryptococcus wingfieldii CBS 7118]